VLWSRGCGFAADDIVVEAGDQIFSAHGVALEGDYVELAQNFQNVGPPVVAATGLIGESGSWCALGAAMRQMAERRIVRFPADIAGWFRGFVIGDKSSIERQMMTDFRDVGLLHVLVLSGGHLSVAAALILGVMRIFLLLPYIARKITMNTWIKYWAISSLFSVVCLFIFCLMVGFSQSVQRAFFAVIVASLLSMLGIAKSPKSRIYFTFFFQAIFFPVNLLSPSMLLSWSGSLLLMGFFESTYLKGFAWSLLQLFKIQLLFFATSLIFFGSVGVLSPVVNLLGQFVFGLLLPLDILVIGLSFSRLDDLAVWINRKVLVYVTESSLYQTELPISFITIPDNFTISAPAGRCLMFVLMITFFSFSGVRQRIRKPKRHAA
jgi:predicted membrane metal-binding protein